MAKQSGLGDHFLIGGYDLSGDIGSLGNIGGGPAASEVTAIDKLAAERLGGLRTGGIEFSSWFNKAAGQEHPALSTLPTTNRIATYCRGYGIGAPAASCLGKQINYDGNRGADGGEFSLAVAVQSDGYGLEWGVQLTAGLRTDTTATNGAALDNGAATSFGAQAYLQVVSFTGTSVTVKLQDSADNATFADLTGATFAAATARGDQRIATANNATVRRYLRVATTGTFTNAVFLVQVTRNDIAGQVF